MTPNEISRDIVDCELEIANTVRNLKYYEKCVQTFKTKLSKLIVGLEESVKRVDTLRESDIVLLQEFRLLRDLQNGFRNEIEKAKMEIAEATKTVADKQLELQILDSKLNTLLGMSVDNVLEFPSESRISEEED
jgi:predicted RNase H-like nuclease (RuvC/YqgF family)